MFSTIVTGPGLITSGGNSSRPYSSGTLFWDHNASAIKVLDPNGTPGSFYPPSVQISFDSTTIDILSWAKKKMIEESSLQALIDKHPGLKDAKEKYEIMLALVKQEETC